MADVRAKLLADVEMGDVEVLRLAAGFFDGLEERDRLRALREGTPEVYGILSRLALGTMTGHERYMAWLRIAVVALTNASAAYHTQHDPLTG